MHGIFFVPRDDISLKNCASVDSSMRNELVPVGIRQVAFLHEKTSLYIAMDQNSKVYSSVRISSIG